MNHCESYPCNLKTGCACRCNCCRPVCKRCGFCEHCGRSDQDFKPAVPYIPYPYIPYVPVQPWIYTSPPGWYCSNCMTYHPYGYQCIWWYSYPNVTGQTFIVSSDINLINSVLQPITLSSGSQTSNSVSYDPNVQYSNTIN